MKTLIARTSAVITLVFTILVAPAVFAAAPEKDGDLLASVDYIFPSYEDAVEKTDAERYCSKEEYLHATKDTRFKLQKLTYLSDGLKVVAYLFKPSITEGKKYPTIIFNRGSYVRGDIAPELVTMFYRLASQGFVVMAPLYRGSDGGEGRDELGGADMNDLMNIVPLVKNLSFVDTDKLFLYGESRGGMMTYQAIKKGFPAKAAAVFGAFVDMEGMIADRPDVYTPQLAKAIWSDFETKRTEITTSRSAIRWVDMLNTPLLVMHGGDDRSVSPNQSLRMSKELLERKKTFELLVYAGDNHRLSKNRVDRDTRAVRWFKQYLAK